MSEEKKERLVSKSQMRQFETCPAQWKFQHIDRAPTSDVDSGPLIFGTQVHQGIADYYEEIDPNHLKFLHKESIRESLTRHLINVKGDQDRIQSIIDNMVTFEWNRYNKYGPECFKPVLVEKTYEVSPFKGIVDVVFLAKAGTKNVIVTDWKTGRYNPSEWDNDGLTIYSFFLIKDGYTVVEASTVFVEHGMKTLNVIDMEKVMKKANNFFHKTGNPNYFFPKKKSWTCRWCPYTVICYYEDDEEFSVEVISESEMALRILEKMKVNGYA